MKDTLEYILRRIVNNPDDISVDEVQEDDQRYTLTVHAHQEDVARIIGRNGRIIKALRDLIKIQAIQDDVFVDVSIAE